MLSAVVVLAALSAAASQQPNRPGGVVIVKADEVAWTDYPNRPGVKLAMIEGDLTGPFLMRVKFPAGYTLARHTHPSIEHTIVLSGELRVGYGTAAGGASEVLPPGTVIITPPNTPHFLAAAIETIVQTHGVGPWGSPAK